MKLGVALPAIDVSVGGDPAAIREFAQAAEEIGYPRTTKLYDRTSDAITLDEIERITI